MSDFLTTGVSLFGTDTGVTLVGVTAFCGVAPGILLTLLTVCFNPSPENLLMIARFA
jgi:hypothetical protein